MTVTA